MRKSIVTLKCFKDDQEHTEYITVLSNSIDDETSNIIEKIGELQSQKHYNHIKYLTLKNLIPE